MGFEPLKGIKILDITSVIVGPVCTWRLGQYGAEIIKLESPDGDLMRRLGGLSPTGEHSGAFLHLNRGKRNICLDLKRQGAKKVLDKLIASADVVVANMRPQALQRLHLDSASIRNKYPEKVYCLITGYGTDGPYSGQPAYDSVIQGAVGIPGLTLQRDGEPNYVPMLICDHVSGEIAAGAILAAIVEQRRSGIGCSIEVPMFETMAALVLQEHLAQHSFEPPIGPLGDQRLLNPYNRPVRTSDGWISFTVNTDSQVRAFLEATNRSHLINDSRFCSVAARARNVEEWFELRGASLTTKPTAEWVDLFRSVDIPVQPCHALETLPKDEHLQAVGLISTEQHPTEGTVAAIRSTIRFDDVYPPLRTTSQPRGWDTRTILQEVGFTEGEIDQLINEQVAVVHQESSS